MLKGRVSWFNSAKGYGFISPQRGGPDMFVHFSQVQMDGYRKLDAGDEVEYVVAPGPQGRNQAEQVRVTRKAEPQE